MALPKQPARRPMKLATRVRRRLQRVNKWLKGKRTYIGLTAATVYAVLCIAGVTESNELTWTLIAVWTGFSFRAAMS